LKNQESDLYKTLFKPLSTNANSADETFLRKIAIHVNIDKVDSQARFK